MLSSGGMYMKRLLLLMGLAAAMKRLLVVPVGVVLFAGVAVAAEPSIHSSEQCLGKPKAAIAKICKSSEGKWNPKDGTCTFPDDPDAASVGLVFTEKNRVEQHMMVWQSAMVAKELLVKARESMGQEDERSTEGDCDVYGWDHGGYLIGIQACPGYSALLSMKK